LYSFSGFHYGFKKGERRFLNLNSNPNIGVNDGKFFVVLLGIVTNLKTPNPVDE
jgi:hypothetical protein